MKHLSTSLCALFLTSVPVHAQCVPNAPCDDADPCTSGDIYTVIPGEVVCGPGTAEFPNPSSNSDWSNLSPEDQRVVSPFMHDLQYRRFRKQYMFLASELDVGMNQMAGNLLATNGLGTCEPVTAIAFYIEAPVTAADQKLWQYAITLKHGATESDNLSLFFDNSIDPNAGCAWSNFATMPALAQAPGWSIIPLGSPFQWDGERDVILEIALAATSGDAVPGVLPVRYTVVNGTAPGNQLTHSAYTEPLYPPAGVPPCSPATPTTSTCAPNNLATALGECGTYGSSNLRPSVLFIGGVTTAPAPECVCAGTITDTDMDGLADCEDPCPLGLNPGEPCDDGDELTTGDMVGEDCTCLGVAMGLAEEAAGSHPSVWPVPCGSTLFLDRMMSGTVIDGRGKQVLAFSKVARLDVGRLAPGPYVLRTAEPELVRFVKE